MIRKACGGGPCLTSSSVRGEVDQISLPSCVWRRGRRFPLRGPRAELGEPPRRPPPRMGAEHWLRPLQTRARRLLTRVSPGLHHQSRTVHYTRWKFRQSPFPLLRPVNCSGTTNKSGVVSFPFPFPDYSLGQYELYRKCLEVGGSEAVDGLMEKKGQILGVQSSERERLLATPGSRQGRTHPRSWYRRFT